MYACIMIKQMQLFCEQKWQESLTELLNRKEGAANNENLSHEQQQGTVILCVNLHNLS